MDVALLVFLILLNGAFAMSEMALTASRKARLQVMVEGGEAGAQAAMELHENPTRWLSTVQVGITSIGILNGIVGEAAFAEPVAEWLQQVLPLRPRAAALSATALVVAIITFLTIIFGELVPKRLGQMYPEIVARLVARPMNWLSAATRPFVWLLGASTETVLRLLQLGRQGLHEFELTRVLSDAVERVGMIHAVRVGIIEPHNLVMLSVTFDGDWEPYMRVVWQKVSRLLDLIFCHTEDYEKNVIKKHEKTRQDKEDDRTNLVDALNANTGTTSSSLTHCPPNLDTSSGSANKNNNRNIMAFSGDRAALKAKVDALVASGNTSIDIGVKWGAGLLDPSMAPVVTSMIAEGKVNAQFGGRPLAYKKASGQWNDEVLKVIVVMTDGENTAEYQLRDNYNFGNSLLVRNNTTKYSATDIKRYSLWDQSRGKYWIFATSAWRTTAWGSNPTDIPTDNSDQALNLSWPDVWALMSVNYFADNIIGPVYGSTERNKWRTGTTTKATTYIDSQKDSQTLAICSAAKANNIKVYTIGFEAPTAGQTLLKSCASSPSQFYSVAGLDIKKAFSSIASSINKLRLTH